jgi:uncharacterized phage protein (TIGR02218 family)
MPRALNPPSLITLLNSGQPYQRVDLWTFVLQSGTALRFVDHEFPLTRTDGATFQRSGPVFSRGGVTQRRGLEASEMSVNIAAAPTDYVYGTVPWLRAIEAGVFDYASVTLDVGILEIGTPTVLAGWYNWFAGEVAAVLELGLLNAELRVSNYVDRLKTLMPRNVVQPGCLNKLYDKACGVNKASYLRSGTVTTVNTDGSLVLNIPGGTPTPDWLDEGTFTITSGDNANVVRKIKKQAGTLVSFFTPTPFPVTVGATWTALPECAGTRTACAAFSNSARFRGMPLVPTPETIL